MTTQGIKKHKAGLNLLKKSLKNLKDPEARSHLYVFFICLLISVFVWLSIKLSEDYQATIHHPVNYVNIPQDKLLTNQPPSEVALKVNGKGTELMRMKLRQPENEINIDLSDARLRKQGKQFHAEMPTVWFLSQVARQSEYYNNLIDIQPDTLFLEFEDLKFKKLPIKHRLKYQLGKQVWLHDSVMIQPDSVIIAGKISAVDTVQAVYTERIKLGTMSEPFSEKVGLKGFKSKSLKIETDSVQITVPVERYTEDRLKLPVQVQGSDTLNIRTFPEKVEVTYWVSLDDYQRIDASMFKLAAAFDSKDDRFLKISLERKSSYVEVKSVEPNKVEYIFLK